LTRLSPPKVLGLKAIIQVIQSWHQHHQVKIKPLVKKLKGPDPWSVCFMALLKALAPLMPVDIMATRAYCRLQQAHNFYLNRSLYWNENDVLGFRFPV